jgi:DNA gyrase inhibitor GyrI
LATGADKTVRPAKLAQIFATAIFAREPPLQFQDRPRKILHHSRTLYLGVGGVKWIALPYVHYLGSTRPLKDIAELRTSQLIVRLEHWPTRTIASKRYIGNTLGMVTLWPQLMKWARQRRLPMEDATFLGLHYDDWDPRIAHKYRYDAAIVVPDGFDDDRVTISTIPGGQVAMFEFAGSLVQLDKAWWRFVNEWIPISGHQFRTEFVFDRYPAVDIAGGRLRSILRTLTGIRATLCIPVERVPGATA